MVTCSNYSNTHTIVTKETTYQYSFHLPYLHRVNVPSPTANTISIIKLNSIINTIKIFNNFSSALLSTAKTLASLQCSLNTLLFVFNPLFTILFHSHISSATVPWFLHYSLSIQNKANKFSLIIGIPTLWYIITFRCFCWFLGFMHVPLGSGGVSTLLPFGFCVGSVSCSSVSSFGFYIFSELSLNCDINKVI